MTSLVDVIFLLLLFFMLSSTFTRFAEVELSAAGTAGAASEAPPLFLQLTPGELRLNGRPVALDALAETLAARTAGAETPMPLLVALRGEVTAQRLTDLLAVLRAVQGVAPAVLAPA
ncbi:MAG: biopolymer transporter ExbD [Paracoccaceae bacterium]